MTPLMKAGSALFALVSLLVGFVALNGNISHAKTEQLIISEISKYESLIKTNVKKLHKLDNGIQLYSFQYISDTTRYVGLMADDLATNDKYRWAVINMGHGHYMINYEKLGLQLITLETWQKEGPTAVNIIASR